MTMPEPIRAAINGVLCPFGTHGLRCRGSRTHSPKVGRWHAWF